MIRLHKISTDDRAPRHAVRRHCFPYCSAPTELLAFGTRVLLSKRSASIEGMTDFTVARDGAIAVVVSPFGGKTSPPLRTARTVITPETTETIEIPTFLSCTAQISGSYFECNGLATEWIRTPPVLIVLFDSLTTSLSAGADR